jgi:hypothetical protein
VKKSIIVAGMAAVVVAGAAAGAALAQSQAPAPAGQSAQSAPPPGGPGLEGRGGERFGRGDRGGRSDGRGFRRMRERPTLEQVQQRNAQWFARIDANKDGRATAQEFQAFREQQRQERERSMFQRFSGGQDSVTLQQLNARTAERYNQGPGRRAAPGTPPAPPAAPAR